MVSARCARQSQLFLAFLLCCRSVQAVDLDGALSDLVTSTELTPNKKETDWRVYNDHAKAKWSSFAIGVFTIKRHGGDS